MVMALGTSEFERSLAAAFRACVLAPADHRLRKNLLFLLQRSDRWDEMSAWIPRQRRPLPARETHPVDLAQSQSRYRWLMDQLESKRSDEGWTPSVVENWKRVFTMDSRHLATDRRPSRTWNSRVCTRTSPKRSVCPTRRVFGACS
jgi:hypothetical protein